uniref:His/Gly/Thr/Pro-type tRNA ligase C-terminal domain-containing protein n=1 Tax=Halorussus litoreus TaxID=1710536 RepID=UPI0022B85736
PHRRTAPDRRTAPGSATESDFTAAVLRDLSLPESDRPIRLYRDDPPELLAAAGNLDKARDEFRRGIALCRQVGEDLGLAYTPVLRTTRGFYDANEAWVASLVAALGEPALLDRRPEVSGESDRAGGRSGRSAGPPASTASVEVAFALADADGGSRSAEIATVRLDAESAGLLDAESGESDPGKNHRLVSCSPVPSVERALAALLAQRSASDAPFPTWLAPTQIRFVPVGERHLDYCDELAADLESARLRADVDDRDATVGERVARAERDGVAYLAVVGDREVAGGDGDGDILTVTDRTVPTEREVSLSELEATVRDEVGDRPQKPQYLPRRMSEQPDFTDR